MEQQFPKLQYRFLGNTDIQLSVLSYGITLVVHTPEQEEKSAQVIKSCLELGINYFDTTERVKGKLSRKLTSFSKI